MFSAMIPHSFVPAGFTYGIVIPLLKNKHGDRYSVQRGAKLNNCARYNPIKMSYPKITAG